MRLCVRVCYLDKVSECVVDVSSFRQEEAASRTDVIKEEQLLVLEAKHTSPISLYAPFETPSHLPLS